MLTTGQTVRRPWGCREGRRRLAALTVRRRRVGTYITKVILAGRGGNI